MKRFLALILCALMLTGILSGCTFQPVSKLNTENAPILKEHSCIGKTKLDYARCFQIYQYEGGYQVIASEDGRNYLLIPEGQKIPQDAEKYICIQQPLQDVYLAATSAMALIVSIDGLSQIRLSGSAPKSWYIPEAVQAMENEELLFAGKYSEPDYELMLEENCDLAIESTMILHAPEVLEKIEELGIPVFIDRSSYEKHPLGRSEWVKAYGAILGHEKLAEQVFEKQAEIVKALEHQQNTEKTVAFFYVTPRGAVATRKSSDYLAKMIEIAGGRYIFQNLGDPEKATSGVTMSMEDFYAGAWNADYIIYNATVDEPIQTIKQLIEKNELFSEFKAVQDGNVWCTEKQLYQATDTLGELIGDFHAMLCDPSCPDHLKFIHKLSE